MSGVVEETVRLIHCRVCNRLHTADGKETVIRIGYQQYKIVDNECKAPIDAFAKHVCPEAGGCKSSECDVG